MKNYPTIVEECRQELEDESVVDLLTRITAMQQEERIKNIRQKILQDRMIGDSENILLFNERSR